MPISKIRPRGDIKTNWETVNPILQLREIGVEWESTIGEGDAKIKFGDGLTHWNDLDYAIVNNITKKIITALAVVEEEDPELNDGEAVDTLFGKIKKKFQTIQSKIAAINTIIGVFEDITIDTGGDSEQAAENITTAINLLNTGKLTTSDIYNGLDSTNTALALSALQGKNLNDAITSLNSDISNIEQTIITIQTIEGYSMEFDASGNATYTFDKNVVVLSVNEVAGYGVVTKFGRTNGFKTWGFHTDSAQNETKKVDIVFIDKI